MEFSGEISEPLNDPDLHVCGNWLTKNHAKVLIFAKPVKTKRCFPCLFNNKNARKQTKIAILPPMHGKIVIFCRLKNNIFFGQNLQIDLQSSIFDVISTICYATFKFI